MLKILAAHARCVACPSVGAGPSFICTQAAILLHAIVGTDPEDLHAHVKDQSLYFYRDDERGLMKTSWARTDPDQNLCKHRAEVRQTERGTNWIRKKLRCSPYMWRLGCQISRKSTDKFVCNAVLEDCAVDHRRWTSHRVSKQ